MYKMQIRKICINSIKLVFLLITVFFVSKFFVYAASTTLDLWSFLDKGIDKLYKKTNKVSGKAVVQDLYDITLNNIKKDQAWPMRDAIWDSAVVLSSICDCNITQQDVINILYDADKSFKRDIKNLIWNEFSEPNKQSMRDSCYTFNSGIAIKNNLLWSVSNSKANDVCQENVAQVFSQIILNVKNSSSVKDSVQDSEAFFNWTLDDSSYDILLDVYDVAKLLFLAPQEPPVVLFYNYSMPELSNADGVYQNKNHTQMDWFSPYNNTTTSTSTQGQWIWSDIIYWSWWLSNQSWNQWNNNINGNADTDIQNFVTTIKETNTETSNPETVYLWNECVSWFSYQFYESGVIVETWTEVVTVSGEVTADEYMEYILGEIDSFKCNNDMICQGWETVSCPDCMWTTGGGSDLDEIEDVLNSVQELWDEELDEATVSCIANCRETQNAIESKVLCVAKCLCKTIESPLFDPIETPWLWPIFKLKYCIIPVTDVSGISKSVTVDTVESIFLEIYKILDWLRNSGELMVSEKTRELVDSAYKKSNIASQLSFTITSDKASHPSQETEAGRVDAQVQFNTQLMSNLLWFSEKLESDEVNKYVIVDDYCEYMYGNDVWSTSASNKESLIDACNQRKHERNSKVSGMDIVSNMENVKIPWTKKVYEQFLSQNSVFWREVQKGLEWIKSQAELLYKKNNK